MSKNKSLEKLSPFRCYNVKKHKLGDTEIKVTGNPYCYICGASIPKLTSHPWTNKCPDCEHSQRRIK